MDEERDLRGRRSLRRFLVRTWHESRNDAIWWIAATLFIAALALAYGTPTGTAAHTPGARSEPARSEAAETGIISSDAGPTGKSDKPNAAGEGSDEEPELSVGSEVSPTQSAEQTASDTKSGGASEAVRSVDFATHPDPALATRAPAHVPRPVAAAPKMTDILVTSNTTHPTYMIVDQIVIASSSEAMPPQPLFRASPEAAQTAARIAALLRLSTVPSLPSTPEDTSSDPSSVGSTPPVVGSFNPTPEPGSLMLLLATVGPLILRRSRR